MVKSCLMDMNGLSTRAYLNILPLGSYDYLIGMDWLEQNNAILYCYNKELTCWHGEGNLKTIHGIPRAINVKEISVEEKLQKRVSIICNLYRRDT
jgi:hypothetical protein